MTVGRETEAGLVPVTEETRAALARADAHSAHNYSPSRW